MPLCLFLLLPRAYHMVKHYRPKPFRERPYYGISKEGIWLSTTAGVDFHGFEQIWSFEHQLHKNGSSSIRARKARHLDQRDGWGRPAIAFTLKGIHNGAEVLKWLQQFHRQHPSYQC